MPTLKVTPDLEMSYVIDDFTDPWTQPETILLLHGNSESHLSWYAWVPILARKYRVVRPDMRGFGASTPMPRDYEWKVERLADDYVALMDALKIERFHLAGAKIGGFIARVLAARHPQRVTTLTLVGTPRPYTENRGSLTQEFEQHGVEHWARRTMGHRLGESFPREGVEWWIRFMGRAPLSTQLGFMESIPHADIREYQPRIACPTLVITTDNNPLVPVAETREWQQQIPNSELFVVPGNSHHVAASDAERCAKAMLEFVERKAH